MRVLTRGALRDFWERHPDAEDALRDWYREVHRVSWDNPAEVRATMANARTIGDSRAIFNIKGNHYRLVVRIDYHSKRVYVRFIGTHAEYDRIDALEV